MIGAVVVGIARVLSGVRPRWVGCAPSLRQRIYFANHTSHLDFAVLWATLPPTLRRLTRPVASRDYWEPNAFRRYLAASVFRAVLVERHGDGGDRAARIERAQRTIELTADALGTDNSLIVFPEGTRGSGVDIAPFKSGIYYLARLRPDVELVPAYLENLNRILPKGEVLPVPLLASVTYGTPLKVEPGEACGAFLVRARAALLALRRA